MIHPTDIDTSKPFLSELLPLYYDHEDEDEDIHLFENEEAIREIVRKCQLHGNLWSPRMFQSRDGGSTRLEPDILVKWGVLDNCGDGLYKLTESEIAVLARMFPA